MRFPSGACHAVGRFVKPATASGGAGHREGQRVPQTARLVDRPSWEYQAWMRASDPDDYRRWMLHEHIGPE